MQRKRNEAVFVIIMCYNYNIIILFYTINSMDSNKTQVRHILESVCGPTFITNAGAISSASSTSFTVAN